MSRRQSLSSSRRSSPPMRSLPRKRTGAAQSEGLALRACCRDGPTERGRPYPSLLGSWVGTLGKVVRLRKASALRALLHGYGTEVTARSVYRAGRYLEPPE